MACAERAVGGEVQRTPVGRLQATPSEAMA